ncbi:MAG: hypothetical protein M5U12_17195 [Verrucomicrobia bacterium]|nr:hypothetical protein [Verrucomicrobiota bacterium]
MLALDPRRRVVGVQATGQDRRRLRKLTGERAQECLDWLRSPGSPLELWAWRRGQGPARGQALIWQPRVQVLTPLPISTPTPGEARRNG